MDLLSPLFRSVVMEAKADEKKDDDKDLMDDEINNSEKDKPLDLIPGKANTAFDSPSTTQYTRFAWCGCDTEEFITSKDEMR